MAHTIIEQLNKTFLTPFDREDIHALAMELDDITDMIHNIVSRLRVYDITGVDKNLGQFAAVIDQSVRAVAGPSKGCGMSKTPAWCSTPASRSIAWKTSAT